MTHPTFSQIRAQVAAIRQKVPQARVIGIRALGRWTGDTERRDGDQAYVIQQCDSPLAMRLALRQPADANATKILITPLEDKDLSDDILLRLAKRRLFQIDPWQIVRSLFDAHAVDPRLTRHAWMAEALLEMPPSEGYPPARGGFLDTDTVWPLLLRQAIDLQAETPDLTTLLKWSLDAEATTRFRQSHDDFRKEAVQWLAEKAGPVAETIMHCVARLDRPDAVPIGLAAGVIHHPSAIGRLEKATGKLEERYLGGHGPASDHMQRWSAAATEVVRALRHTESKTYRQVIQRADEILGEVQAEGFAYVSDTSPLGFDQRLARVGQRLLEVVERLEKGAGPICAQHPLGRSGKLDLSPFPDAVQAIARRHQGRGGWRRADREAAEVRDLPQDAGRLLRRAGREGHEQGRAVRKGGEAAVHQRTGADEVADRRGQAADYMDEFLPPWRPRREELNRAPLAHEDWEY